MVAVAAVVVVVGAILRLTVVGHILERDSFERDTLERESLKGDTLESHSLERNTLEWDTLAGENLEEVVPIHLVLVLEVIFHAAGMMLGLASLVLRGG